MNNQIKNDKVNVPTGIALNDKDYINSLLSTLKELNKNYVLALTEASNEVLFNEYKNMFEQFNLLQREVFELMFKKGWYVLSKAENEKIIQKYDCLNKEFNDLNNWDIHVFFVLYKILFHIIY